ncbi:MAG: ExbD/TolR family protein [Kofleriaceae bacterium]
MELSAQRVRSKTRAAIKRREEQIEQEEMESGELNLIPYLDMVTNLMLFLLASVAAQLILVQIDTTLPDKAPPSTSPSTPSTNPDEQPLKLFVSIKRDDMIVWSASGLEGTLAQPKASFKRVGKDGETCDGPYMCESNVCDTKALKCVASEEEPQIVFDYRALNNVLFEIAKRRFEGRPRKADSYQIILQADGQIPYSTIVSVMAAMRCKLPDIGKEPTACALPTDDPNLKKAPTPFSADKKLYDTTRAPYDPKTMALFHEIAFSSGFE